MRERFDALLASYVEKFNPRDQIEFDLVSDLAICRWRLQRLWSIETAMLDLEMDRQEATIEKQFKRIDEPTRLACAYRSLSDESSSLDKLHRHESRLRRAYERKLAKLEEIAASREPDPAPAPAVESSQSENRQNEPGKVIILTPATSSERAEPISSAAVDDIEGSQHEPSPLPAAVDDVSSLNSPENS